MKEEKKTSRDDWSHIFLALFLLETRWFFSLFLLPLATVETCRTTTTTVVGCFGRCRCSALSMSSSCCRCMEPLVCVSFFHHFILSRFYTHIIHSSLFPLLLIFEQIFVRRTMITIVLVHKIQYILFVQVSIEVEYLFTAAHFVNGWLYWCLLPSLRIQRTTLNTFLSRAKRKNRLIRFVHEMKSSIDLTIFWPL